MLLLSTAAFAQTRDVKVTGAGVQKCTEWQQWKEAKNGEARALVIEWVRGFMSGHNFYARVGNQPAGSVVADAKVLVPLLDAYCQKNPDHPIFTAVLEITQSLGGARFDVAPAKPAPRKSEPDKKGERES